MSSEKTGVIVDNVAQVPEDKDLAFQQTVTRAIAKVKHVRKVGTTNVDVGYFLRPSGSSLLINGSCGCRTTTQRFYCVVSSLPGPGATLLSSSWAGT